MTSLDVSGDPGGPSSAVRDEICSYPVSPFAGWTDLEIQQWARQHHLYAAAEPIAHFLARSRLKRAIDECAARTTMSVGYARSHFGIHSYDDGDQDLMNEVVGSLVALREQAAQNDTPSDVATEWPERMAAILLEIRMAAIPALQEGEKFHDADIYDCLALYALDKWDGPDYHILGRAAPGTITRAYNRFTGRFAIPEVARQDKVYHCFQDVDTVIPHNWPTTNPLNQEHPRGWDRRATLPKRP